MASRPFATTRRPCCELAAESGDMVLSTGGGVVLRPENRAALRRGFSHVMYLRASPDEDLQARAP